MSTTRILTLFGEEIVNEPAKPPAKGRVRAKDAELQDAEENEDETIAIADDETANKHPEASIVPIITLFDVAPEAVVLPIEPEPISATEISIKENTTEDYSTTADNDAEELYADILPDDTNSIAEEDELKAADDSNEYLPTETTATAGTLNDTQLPGKTDEIITDSETTQTTPKPEHTNKTKKAPQKEKNIPEHIIPEDWDGEKKYYSIGEVADFFKVKTSHIRFWTNEFNLKVRTTRKGDRLFTPEQIKELRAIYHLTKERGFTISGAKAKLKAKNNIDVSTVDLKASLVLLKTKLIALRKQLG